MPDKGKSFNFCFIFLIPILVVLNSSCKDIIREDEVVTATLKGPSAISMIYMIDEKPVLEGNFKTRFLIKSEPELVRALMLEERVDFAVLPSTTAAILYNKTGKYQLAAIPVWGTLYLCGKDSGIHKWSDLKGKEIHLMGQGMTPDVLFRFLAEKNDLNPDTDLKLNYKFNGHLELANALSSGIVEFGVISEPMVSQIISNNPEMHSLLSMDKEWEKLFRGSVPLAQTALVVKKSFAQKHSELVEAYLIEYKKSVFRLHNNTGEAAGLIVKYGILPDKKIAEISIPLSNIRYMEAGEEFQGINEYFKVFLNFNPLIIGGNLPDEGFYYKKEDL